MCDKGLECRKLCSAFKLVYRAKCNQIIKSYHFRSLYFSSLQTYDMKRILNTYHINHPSLVVINHPSLVILLIALEIQIHHEQTLILCWFNLNPFAFPLLSLEPHPPNFPLLHSKSVPFWVSNESLKRSLIALGILAILEPCVDVGQRAVILIGFIGQQ